MSEKANIVFIPTRLLLAFVVFHMDHNLSVTNCERTQPLRIAPGHREELVLSYRLTTADVDKRTLSLEELLYRCLIGRDRTRSPDESARRVTVFNEKEST